MVESDDVRQLKKEARTLVRALEPFTKAREGAGTFVVELEAALKKLPDPGTFSRAVAELRDRANELAAREKARRAEEFGRIEAAFIHPLRGAGASIRETSRGWRVEELEIELQRDQSRARVLFNNEVVLPWAPVASQGDLESLVAKARGQFGKYDVDEQELIGVVSSAFARAHAEASERANRELVPIHDLLLEIRLELVRRELGSRNAGRKLRTAEFPLWALLRNLDRYRSLSSRLDDNQRVAFQTGSQQEQSKGLGVVLNGLVATEPYRVYCYARSLS